MTGETVLYRHLAADGELLYVGIARDPYARWAQHKHLSAWASRVETVKMERFQTRREAEHAERVAVATENPKFNVALKDSVERTRAQQARTLGSDAAPAGTEMTIKEAALATGATVKAIQRRIDRGNLPSQLRDGKRRILVEDLASVGLIAKKVSATEFANSIADEPNRNIIIELVDRLLANERALAEARAEYRMKYGDLPLIGGIRDFA